MINTNKIKDRLMILRQQIQKDTLNVEIRVARELNDITIKILFKELKKILSPYQLEVYYLMYDFHKSSHEIMRDTAHAKQRNDARLAVLYKSTEALEKI